MKTIRNLLFSLVFLLGGLFISSVSGDPPSEPPAIPGGGHGGSGNQSPEGAPIDGGLGILYILGTAFAGMRIFRGRGGSPNPRH